MIDEQVRLLPILASKAPIIALVASSAQAQFGGGTSVKYGQTLSPAGVTSGDFDRGGDLDLDDICAFRRSA